MTPDKETGVAADDTVFLDVVFVVCLGSCSSKAGVTRARHGAGWTHLFLVRGTICVLGRVCRVGLGVPILRMPRY